MMLRSHPRMTSLGLSQQLCPLQSKEKGTAGIGMGAQGRESDSGASGPHSGYWRGQPGALREACDQQDLGQEVTPISFICSRSPVFCLPPP